jgi:uncharacterized membrane protein
MFNWFKQKSKDFFTPDEQRRLKEAVQKAELQTSGEIRLFVESKCNYVNALDRAIELFDKLDMYKTEEHNAVLVYIAIKHRQLAIYGDKGIHEKVGNTFWQNEIKQMVHHFNRNDYTEGLCTIINDIGKALKQHFPYNKISDVNELPDDIVFGK